MQIEKIEGLKQEEVDERIKSGLVNKELKTKTKSIGQIIYSNVFNYFNLLNLVLAILIALSKQYKNMLFMSIIVINTVIAIVQEIRSKKMIDKLTFMSKTKLTVIRDKKEQQIIDNELVIDDVFLIKTGDQLPVDAIIINGNIEVDESNITGESISITKKEGDLIYSGTVVVSGSGYLKVVNVGKDTFVNKMAAEVKSEKIYPSKLRDTLNKILKIVTAGIIPVGILLFLKNNFIFKFKFSEMILRTVTPLIGMVPEGLILLTSVALAVSVYKLANKKILVQELYCVETLARVDVLCVDKTGTITEGNMRVSEVIGDISEIMPSYLSAFDYENPSDKALINHFGKDKIYEIKSKVDFSSKRKYSAVNFNGKGTYVLGAFEFIIKNPTEADSKLVEKYAKKGLRVLTFAKSTTEIALDLPEDLEVKGFIIIEDILRENTKELFEFFKKEDVKVKIISGDNPVAVSEIAKRAGFSDVKYIDTSKLSDEEIEKAVLEYNIFGRVTPSQKKLMVKVLKENGHTVAMTGDGVNDVLALKEADVSIAMAGGSDAAKQISNIVLLENNLKNLYDILMEGRRVINNIQKVAILFLTKTAYSIILSILSLLTNIHFPFIPIQITLISSLTIGIPAFILTFEKSKHRIKKHFMKEILGKAGIIAVIFSFTILLLNYILRLTNQYTNITVFTTISTYLALINGLLLITLNERKLNIFKIILVIVLGLLTISASIWGVKLFSLTKLNLQQNYIMAGFSVLLVIAQAAYFRFLNKKQEKMWGIY